MSAIRSHSRDLFTRDIDVDVVGCEHLILAATCPSRMAICRGASRVTQLPIEWARMDILDFRIFRQITQKCFESVAGRIRALAIVAVREDIAFRWPGEGSDHKEPTVGFIGGACQGENGIIESVKYKMRRRAALAPHPRSEALGCGLSRLLLSPMRSLSRSSRPLVDDAFRLGRWGGAAAIRDLFGNRR